jgi:hypothetical protein
MLNIKRERLSGSFIHISAYSLSLTYIMLLGKLKISLSLALSLFSHFDFLSGGGKHKTFVLGKCRRKEEKSCSRSSGCAVFRIGLRENLLLNFNCSSHIFFTASLLFCCSSSFHFTSYSHTAL